MPRRSHESLGDYISSACFGGVAFLSLLNGLEAFYAGNFIRAIVIWFVCFLLCLAVFRYSIARLFDSLSAKKNKKLWLLAINVSICLLHTTQEEDGAVGNLVSSHQKFLIRRLWQQLAWNVLIILGEI